MKKLVLVLALVVTVAGIGRAGNDKDRGDKDKGGQNDDRNNDDRHSYESTEFRPQTLVLSRSVYSGEAGTVTTGQVLPPGCVANAAFPVPVLPAFVAANGGSATTPVKISCSHATNDGTYPNVLNNNIADGSFGVTSPIFLDNITRDGALLGTLNVDPKMIVTSFSSKSELALNLSLDKKSITFVGYVGGPSSVTDINQLDVSNSNTPGVVDPTNPVVTPQFYRSVAEVDASGISASPPATRTAGITVAPRSKPTGGITWSATTTTEA